MNVNGVELARLSSQAALTRKAEYPVILDLRGISDICDYQVVCSGANTRQTRAICDTIAEQIRQMFALNPLVTEGKTKGNWISMDYGFVIIHIFCTEVRSYYEFDHLWPQAKTIACQPDTASGG